VTVDDQEITIVRERRGGGWYFDLEEVTYYLSIESATKLFGIKYVLSDGSRVVSEVVETEKWKWYRNEFIVRCLGKSYYLRIQGGLRKDLPTATLLDGQREVGWFKSIGSLLSDTLVADFTDDISLSSQIMCLIALRNERNNPGTLYVRGRAFLRIGE